MLPGAVACLALLVVGASAEKADKYKDVIIQKHNDLRRKQNANNMNELVWSDELAQEADRWVAHCNFEHEMKGRGENLAFNTGTDEMGNIEEAFTGWYDEIKQYRLEDKVCGSSCHYTQLVWHNTREVGCAIKTCPILRAFGTNQKNGWFFACYYNPQGNDMSEFPFVKGEACSDCLEGQTCKNGLCSGIGKEKCEDLVADCDQYEASGACKGSNKAYMEKNCRQACAFCEGGPPRPCEDKIGAEQCAQFKFSCETNVPYMKPHCKKTCGYCK